MERDYEHDKWIPWYVEDTQSWLELSLAARGAMAEIARKLNAKGEIALRRGLPQLAFVLRLRWEGELEPALAELLRVGKVTWDGESGVLADPQFEARKRRGSAERMRAKRARDAGDVTSVTSSHVTRVTPVLVSSSLSDLDMGSDAGAREATPPEVADDPAPDPLEVPDWFTSSLEVVRAGTGIEIAPVPSWLRYSGHRASTGKPMGPKDAQQWLMTVDVREITAERGKLQREADRQAKWDQERRDAPPRLALRAVPDTPPAPYHGTNKQAEADRVRWAREAGTPTERKAAAQAAMGAFR